MGRLPFKVCLLACIAALPSTNALASCWGTQETKAAQVRSLDTLLKIGAQRCQETDAALGERYDAFARQHQATLDANDLALKARFMREAGIAGGQQAYDDFIASLGETHSARLADAQLCPTIDSVTKLATAGSAADLETLAATFAPNAVAADQLCTDETAAAAETETAPAPAAAETAEPARPGQTTLSQQEALAAAAAALQSATEALKAAQAKPATDAAAGPDADVADDTADEPEYRPD